MSNPIRDLTVGLGLWLQEQGVASWDTPQAGLPVASAVIEPATPDAVITLTVSLDDSDYSLSDSVAGVQVRTRAGGDDSLAASDLAWEVLTRLHGVEGLTLPNGVHVVSAAHRGGSPLEPDQTGRSRHTDNYWLTIHAPSQNRT